MGLDSNDKKKQKTEALVGHNGSPEWTAINA